MIDDDDQIDSPELDNSPELSDNTELIEKSDISNEMKSSFLSYAMSVIVSRALPDVRDGLKPVHRRILFAMHGLKVFHNRPYLKCARVVGDVLGKYHPHGDSSVYDALVRMSQDFSMRYPVIDGQGNFGSIDGDGAAAMRYTESRMKSYAEQLLMDLDKGTVDFVPNYDNKELEPVVLPSRIPHLLVNGSSGIAVGMATFILPHNLAEVMSALQAFIENPNITVDEIMQILPGPDFPQGAEIHGISGIRSAYLTGRGSIKVRSKTIIEEFDSGAMKGKSRIIISEIPYMINKANLVESIALLVQSKKIEGITDIRDESSKDGIRIVIECKRSESPQIILNYLFKLTKLQTSYGINSVSLVKGVPKLLSLKEMLSEFYRFRRQVVLRRTAYLLAQAKERELFLLAIKVALDDIDNVVEIIKNAVDTAAAAKILQSSYDLLEKQAKAILEMRLARLTSLERSKIVKEIEEIGIKIKDLNDILTNSDRVTQIVLQETKEISDNFKDERRTVILKSDADDITLQSLVDDVSVVVIVSAGGYIKRTTTTEIQAQKRGGKGRSGILITEDDSILQIIECTNHQDLLCFTSFGRVYSIKVYLIPEAGLRHKGKHFANLLPLMDNEQVVTVIAVDKYDQNKYVCTLSTMGMIKLTSLSMYSKIRSSGIIGVGLKDGDSLTAVKLCTNQDYILIASSAGKLVRFIASSIRPSSRGAMGVKGIKLKAVDEKKKHKKEKAISLAVVSPQQADSISLLSVSERGFGKRSLISDYRLTARNSMGVITQKVTEKTGPLMGVYQLGHKDDIVLITSKGTILRMNIAKTAMLSRNTQGVRLMRVSEDEVIQSVGVIDFNELVETDEIDDNNDELDSSRDEN